MKKILGMLFLACIMAFFGCKKDDSVSGQGDTNDCFYFEAVDAGAVVSMVKYADDEDASKVPDVSLEYSLNKSNWSPFVVGETNVSLENVGDRVYIRAKDKNDYFCSYYSSYEGVVWARNSFSSSERVKVGGNIMYLLDGTGKKTVFDTQLNKYVFGKLFSDMVKLTDASKLTLPATTLAEDCYVRMFEGCSSLTVAPELPATTLADGCYVKMFKNCSSLTVAPELPATTLAENCYSSLFSDCSSLIIAPELPATTLVDECYSCMFSGCKSLIVAPKLPATTLASYCYDSMFKGCTSLTVAPELPATTLAKYCYGYMFCSCGSLTIAPKLLATTLTDECYTHIFTNCSSLQSIEVNFTDWGNNETHNWVQGVSETGTFTCPAELDVTKIDYTYIPYGWTIVTK